MTNLKNCVSTKNDQLCQFTAYCNKRNLQDQEKTAKLSLKWES